MFGSEKMSPGEVSEACQAPEPGAPPESSWALPTELQGPGLFQVGGQED